MKTLTRTYCVNHPTQRVLRRGLCGICYQKLGETGALLGLTDPPPSRSGSLNPPELCRSKRHQMWGDNVGRTPSGGKYCRPCKRERERNAPPRGRHVGTAHKEGIVRSVRLLTNLGWSKARIADLIDIGAWSIHTWLETGTLPRYSVAQARGKQELLDAAIRHAYAAREAEMSLPPYLKCQKRGEGDG